MKAIVFQAPNGRWIARGFNPAGGMLTAIAISKSVAISEYTLMLRECRYRGPLTWRLVTPAPLQGFWKRLQCRLQTHLLDQTPDNLTVEFMQCVRCGECLAPQKEKARLPRG